jgi:hypothetical protein
LEGYKKIMGAAEAEEEVKKIMSQVDKNGSGEIDYSGTNFYSLDPIKNSLLLRSIDRKFSRNSDWRLLLNPLIRMEAGSSLSTNSNRFSGEEKYPTISGNRSSKKSIRMEMVK